MSAGTFPSAARVLLKGWDVTNAMSVGAIAPVDVNPASSGIVHAEIAQFKVSELFAGQGSLLKAFVGTTETLRVGSGAVSTQNGATFTSAGALTVSSGGASITGGLTVATGNVVATGANFGGVGTEVGDIYSDGHVYLKSVGSHPTNAGGGGYLSVVGGEMYFIDASDNEVQITSGGSINVGSIAYTMDDAYGDGHTIAVDDGSLVLNMAYDASPSEGLGFAALDINVGTAANDLANASTGIDFRPGAGAYTALVTALNVDYSGATSLTSTSDYKAIALAGKTNAGSGSSIGLYVDSNWDKGIQNVGTLDQDGTADFAAAVSMSADSATLTHSGSTSLTIASTSGTVIVDGTTFNSGAITAAGAISGATSIDGSGDLTVGTITMTGFSVDGSGVMSALTGSSIGNLTLADGSITDSGGTISFGDENLSTTGTLAAGVTSITSLKIDDGATIGTDSDTDMMTLTNASDITIAADLALKALGSLEVGGGYGSTGATISATGNGQFNGNLTVDGNLYVQGEKHVTEGETIVYEDNYLDLNHAYTADSAQSGGIVANYDPTTTVDTVAGAYVAGVAATSNPSVTTTGSATFAQGDIVMLSKSGGGASNPGFYEVHDHTGTTLQLRGIGLNACVEAFTVNQLTAGSSDGAAITKVNVSVMRCGVDGIWEYAKGATTGLSYKHFALTDATDGSVLGLDQAYDNGAEITTSGSTPVLISGTEKLQITASGGLDVDGAVDIDGGNLTLDGGTAALTANGASSFSTSSGALTLTSAAAATWSTVAGILTLDGAGGVAIAGNAGEIDLTTTGALDLNGGAVTIDSSGAMTLTAADGQILTVQGGDGSAELVISAAGAVSLASEAGQAMTLNGASGLTLQEGGTAQITIADSGDITLADAANDVLVAGTGGSTSDPDFRVAGYAQFAGAAEFDGAVEFDSTTQFDGASTFNVDLELADDVEVLHSGLTGDGTIQANEVFCTYDSGSGVRKVKRAIANDTLALARAIGVYRASNKGVLSDECDAMLLENTVGADINDVLYLSKLTAGRVTTVAPTGPGEYLTRLGVAWSKVTGGTNQTVKGFLRSVEPEYI